MVKLKALLLNGAFIATLCLPAAFAQTSPPTPAPNQPPDGQQIQQRKENQQDRIANGVQSGQLTAGETKQLERGEARINNEEHNMAADNGGKLTDANRARLNRQENRLSNQIYKDKHNANTAQFGNGKIGQRRENQQDRIAQGIRSGQLTAGEASRLESGEQHLNREMAGARQLNGGKLTKGERAAVNRQQNKLSGAIYKDKHNAARQKK